MELLKGLDALKSEIFAVAILLTDTLERLKVSEDWLFIKLLDLCCQRIYSKADSKTPLDSQLASESMRKIIGKLSYIPDELSKVFFSSLSNLLDS